MNIDKSPATPLGMVIRREPDTVTIGANDLREILKAAVRQHLGRELDYISDVKTTEHQLLGMGGPRHHVDLTITLKPETK